MEKQRLTDAEATQLLKRASELDAERSTSLDIDTVRDIAREAGISSSSLDEALRENALKGQARVAALEQRPRPRGIRLASRAALAAGGAYLLYAFLSRLIV